MKYHAQFPEMALTSTYHAEVWGEMEVWLRNHCRGTFRLVGPCEGFFQHRDDVDAFAAVWHGGLVRELVERDPSLTS